MFSSVYVKNIFVLLCAVTGMAVFSISCKSEKLIAVITQGKKLSQKIENVSVKIELARDNLMRNALTVKNNSPDTIVVNPEDIVLKVDRGRFRLQAVADFKGYIAMRHSAAKEACAQSQYQYSCENAIESFFRPFTRAKVFQFGSIPPGRKCTGLIAFNLPDPFNTTDEAKRLADSLKSKMSLLDGKIVVSASTKSRNREFTFPVNITTFSDETYLPLRVLKFF